MGLLDFARLKKFWEEKVKPYVQTSLEGYAKKTDLFSKNYNDLTNKPTIPTDYTVITLSADSGTLTADQLAKLKANPHKIVFVRSGFYYFAENLSSSSTWYYSCNVYYSGSNIIKRVLTITTASGAYTKTDYTYTPPSGGSAEIGDTIEVNKINFSYDGASTTTSITRKNDRLSIVSGDSISLSGGHAGSILMYGSEETIYIEGEKKSVIHTYNGGGDTKISVEDDGQDTGLITIKGRKNVSMRSDGTLHIGVSDEYGSAINFYDDDSGIEIDTNNLLLGKVTQIYASSSKGSSDASSGEVGQVLTSNGDGELYWGDAPSGGTGDNSSITDLGAQNDHKCAQDAMFNSLTEAETGCYLFKYYCNCSETACFAIVYKFEGYVEGTVYDSNHRFRQFYYDTETGEFIHDGCWLPIASWSDELETLKTDAKTVENAINEINAKVGNGGGAGLSMPRIRVNGWRYEEIPVGNDVGGKVEFTSGKIIFSVNVQDGTVQEGDELQVCAVRNVFGRKKLRPILSKTITAEDLENLTKQPFLQISTDDISGNNLAQTSNKAIKSFYHTDSEDFRKPKPKYVRVRRPIYDENGQEVNAIFSNVVPVEILLRFFEQV